MPDDPSALPITNATADDIPGIIAIERDAFQTDPFPEYIYDEILTSDTSALRVMRDGSRIAGYCLLVWDATESLLNLANLAIHPDYRRRGLATQLLIDAETIALELNKFFIVLEVEKTNAAAIQLYERHGYELHAEIAEYYSNGEAALRYVKFLGGEKPAFSA